MLRHRFLCFSTLGKCHTRLFKGRRARAVQAKISIPWMDQDECTIPNYQCSPIE